MQVAGVGTEQVSVTFQLAPATGVTLTVMLLLDPRATVKPDEGALTVKSATGCAVPVPDSATVRVFPPELTDRDAERALAAVGVKTTAIVHVLVAARGVPVEQVICASFVMVNSLEFVPVML